ncbi:hypothetical protein IOD16_02780 [Saccharothrix sp. 6-C]|uniref:hypothetical protein n=1 Tax=Saccharothrix sp. 6-C TaxID=2781735 RepID=UPI001916CBBF|nr:hypothetical protein [Saccharothrix sp. 6-C]QQQ77475.1 hypothetical protein IOD16_02780 [Saccharothrix sp. 6-C]
MDAIIVPTSRPWRYLCAAIDTAAVLGRPLLVLCSGEASPHRTVKLARTRGVEMLLVDVGALPASLMPRLSATAKVLSSTEFLRHTDTSFKRNLGLLVSRVVGWERVAFLDDDITVPTPSDLDAAAGLVSEGYAAVGLEVGGFPDNSVVCHAHRETGGDQGTFIGGGALVIGRESMTSFFPTIYNEDWFFLLDDAGLRRSAITGRVEQKPYDPFANESRAQMEEFGDCLAEGVFALLDDDGGRGGGGRGLLVGLPARPDGPDRQHPRPHQVTGTARRRGAAHGDRPARRAQALRGHPAVAVRAVPEGARPGPPHVGGARRDLPAGRGRPAGRGHGVGVGRARHVRHPLTAGPPMWRNAQSAARAGD